MFLHNLSIDNSIYMDYCIENIFLKFKLNNKPVRKSSRNRETVTESRDWWDAVQRLF